MFKKLVLALANFVLVARIGKKVEDKIIKLKKI